MDYEVLKAHNSPKQSLKIDSKKSKKPLMEKMRRARINDSLNELKGLVLDALQKDASRYSKMEKADILEMTVKYLKTLQRNKRSLPKEDASLARYRAGFNECASEINRYLVTEDNVNDRLQTQILSHLASFYAHTETTQKQRNDPTRLPPPTLSTLPPVWERLHDKPIHFSALPSPPSSPFKARDKSLIGVVASPPVVIGNGLPAILVPNDARVHFLPFALPTSADNAVWRPW